MVKLPTPVLITPDGAEIEKMHPLPEVDRVTVPRASEMFFGSLHSTV